ncbi:MAG TPA: hypothetical protein VHO25_24615, partial [Polyangiaceae bacterium]|nr:hypothetical protein [Polyangiaceae bacterium]
AKLFLERAFQIDRDSPEFGLWCTFGLELLARAAVASISPTLLAEPDRDQNNLLHALGRGKARTGPKSLSSAQLFKLCDFLFDEFTVEHTTAAIALINRRNEELHSGASAFADYSTKHWIPGFYACCKALAGALGESLEDLLGAEEAREAKLVLDGIAVEVKNRVREAVRSHKSVFDARSPEEQAAVRALADEKAKTLTFQKHHKVTCPACGSNATVQGQAFGTEKVLHDDDTAEVVVRQSVAPRMFSCPACGLKLEGYADLSGAGLGDQYTRTTRYSPEEYYELLHPDDYDSIKDIYERNHLGREYDNE